VDQHGSKLDEHKERIRELLLLQRVARRISSILDLERLLEEILTDVSQTFGYHRTTVWLKDDATSELVLHGWTGPHHRQGDRFRIGIDGIVGHVGVTREIYNAPNVLVDPYYQLGDEHSRSELAIPLMVGNRLIGIFDVEHTEIDAFSPARVQLLEALAGTSRRPSRTRACSSRTPASITPTQGSAGDRGAAVAGRHSARTQERLPIES
jgi:phosphoserine phosphatase RsbU/P